MRAPNIYLKYTVFLLDLSFVEAVSSPILDHSREPARGGGLGLWAGGPQLDKCLEAAHGRVVGDTCNDGWACINTAS
jgi:hypothetical protein